jgi:hypothetical protein
MPGAPEIVVEGADLLAAAMQTAARNPDLLHAGNLQSAQIVARRARTLAPIRSGRLRAAIRPGAEPSHAVVTVGVVYAGNQEYGWLNRPNRSRGWRGGPFRGHFYVTRATTQTERAQLAAYEQNVAQVMGQIAKA